MKASEHKPFINDCYLEYKQTGNLKPLLHELKMLTLSMCMDIDKRFNSTLMMESFNNGELWSQVLERITRGLKYYRKGKGKPFPFFYGLIKKHCELFFYNTGRAQNSKKQTVRFDEAIFHDYDIPNPCNEITTYIDKLCATATYKRTSKFLKEIKLSIIDGSCILKLRDGFKSKYKMTEKQVQELDLMIVVVRRKWLNI